jgi:hypothetical protein
VTRSFTFFFAAAVLALSACGDGGGSSSSSNLAGPPGTGGGGNNAGGAIVTPTVVTVAPGGTVSGVDITVPAGSPGLNAAELGTSDAGSDGGTATSNGDVIHRGATRNVLIFGQGLSSNVEITISGPPDITVTNPRTISSTLGKPGLEFTAVVDPNAALGARTVRLRRGNNVATFTGGLEVIP